MKVEIENLVFCYPTGERAIDGVSLTISGTEPVAIVGQNGAGKTTLVKHLNGILSPTSGTVLIDGVDVTTRPTSQWAQVVGYVFQNPDDQLFAHTVADELRFGPRQIGLEKAEIERRMQEVAEMVGLAGDLLRHPYDLTSTEKKFCTIGSVLMMEPDLVVFDEPTCGQDTAGRKRLDAIVGKLREKGVLCITISHDMKFVAANFGRVIVMNEGRALLDGSAREVFAQPEVLKAAFVSPPPVTRVAQSAGVCGTPFEVRELIWNINKMKRSQKSNG